jgi:ABC-2 type transport system permease protein
MKRRRVWAVARKEFLHVFRDRLSLAIAIALPMVLLVLFGYALSFDVDNVPVVVWDQSQSQASRELLSHFNGSRYFSLRGQVWNYRDLERAIDTGAALMGIVVPSDFADRQESGRSAALQVILDGSDSNTATIAAGYVETVVQSYSQQISLTQVYRRGERPPDTPVEMRPRVWFNPELESRNYIIPGLIAVIMMVIAALLSSLTVAREWERGTMEQLISTPVQGCELILGKLVPYFCIGMFDVLLAVFMGEFLFHIPLRGSVALIFGTAAVFLAGALSLGILVSVLTKSQLLASQLAMVLTFLPAYLLSGFMTPIANMPKALQLLTYLIPARYFVTLLKSIYLKGVGLEILAREVILLTAFGALMVTLAIVSFKRKLD